MLSTMGTKVQRSEASHRFFQRGAGYSRGTASALGRTAIGIGPCRRPYHETTRDRQGARCWKASARTKSSSRPKRRRPRSPKAESGPRGTLRVDIARID
jgi:hypothetical protein